MKKILSLLAVIFVTISASAQMYIWHNGQIIGEYDILGLDSVSFRKIVYHSVSADNVAEGEIIGLGNYPEGASLQVSAEPARGYKFEGWCDIESTENPRIITVTQDIKLCATFVKDTFNVALSVANEAMGSVTESTRVAFAKELVITATANTGYRFASWSDGYTENPRTIVVENDKNITALFITEIFNITTASSNDTYGYVVGAGTYPYGSTISLYACTNEGGKFMQWSDGSTENPRRITITADSLFTAEFSQKEVEQPEQPEQPQEPELNYELRVLTFEDKDAKFSEYELEYCSETISTWSDLIATPEYMADMLYAMFTQSEDDRYAWYDEGNTFLASELPYNFYDYVYWGGGHAISNYASGDYVTYGSYENQLTVYGANQTYGETLTGGHNGSANFCMHFGYKDGSPYNGTENLPYIYFKDETPRIIDHMYINNSAYAINCYMSGNGLTAKIGPDDWVKIVAIGYDSDGNETGRTDIYLCNGPDNIVMEWTKWDLSVLGKVAKVDFNITGSSDNGYGFSQPAYFAYDDVAVRFDK